MDSGEREPKRAKTETCIITGHLAADADVFSSMIAASILYPDAYLLWPGSPNVILEALVKNLASSPQQQRFIFNLTEINVDSVKKLVVVDTHNVQRLKHVQPLLERAKEISIDIYDHHPDTSEDVKDFSFSLVEPCGSATALLIRKLRSVGCDINRNEATWLGMGIYEDTGCFTYSTTTTTDMESASFLLSKGMDLKFIYDYLHKHNSANFTVLSPIENSVANQLLSSARKHHIYGKEIIILSASEDTELRNFSAITQSIMEEKEWPTVFALGAFENCVVVVGRALNKDYLDVGAICKELGGGGHFCAASARIKDASLSEVYDRLFAVLLSKLGPEVLSVRKLMTSPVHYVRSTQNIDEACATFRNFNLKRIPVVEPLSESSPTSWVCVGIVDRVTLEKANGHGFKDRSVTEFMETHFNTLPIQEEGTTSASQVIDIILSTNQRLVPVVDPTKGNSLVGVISRADIVSALMKEPGRFPQLITQKKEKNLSNLAATYLPGNVFQFLKDAGALADKLNVNVYIVGGGVRDIIMNRHTQDIDLVVEGDGTVFAEELAKIKGDGRPPTIHDKFKTATVTLQSGLKIDITTARMEYYPQPVSLPTVELSSLKMDLYRRDFGMNAMAMQINTAQNNFGKLVDFFNGEKDISRKTINVLHSLSFVEDPTRIFRAIRFEQRYSFDLGNQTERLLKNAIKMEILSKLSGSRMWHELVKMFCDKAPKENFQRMHKLKILPQIHPALSRLNFSLFHEAIQVKQLCDLVAFGPPTNGKGNPNPNSYTLWKFYLLVIMDKMSAEESKQLMEKFLFPSGVVQQMQMEQQTYRNATKQLRQIFNNHPTPFETKQSEIYFLLQEVSIEAIMVTMSHLEGTQRQHMVTYLTHVRNIRADINGNDLIALGHKPGPRFATVLKEVLKAKLDGIVSSQSSQLELADTLLREKQEL